MIRSYSSCLILTALFRVIFGHDQHSDFTKRPQEPWRDLGIYKPYRNLIPKRCWRAPHNIDLHKCCPRPSLYSDEVMKRCVEPMKTEHSADSLNSIANSEPKGIPKKRCQVGICLMQNTNLLKANGSIDYEKLEIYLDEWAAANPDFTEAILAAKPICGKENHESWYPGQPPPCDPDRVFLCLMSQMLWRCKLKEFKECEILGAHMKECKTYYFRDEQEKKREIKYKFEIPYSKNE